MDYLDRLIERKLEGPGDDLISRLGAERVATGQLTRWELAAMAVLLLVGGHETTANMIALGTYALLAHPDQLALVRDCDDPDVIERTVEELLRYLSIVHSGRRRVAIEDIEIAGKVIRTGEGIILPSETANRDDVVFPDPDRLDVRRDARSHVAFGFGVHQCLGQAAGQGGASSRLRHPVPARSHARPGRGSRPAALQARRTRVRALRTAGDLVTMEGRRRTHLAIDVITVQI